MSMLMRVNGAWLRLLTDWLDREGLAAPGLRARVAAHAPDDPVPLPVWNALLHEAATLRPGQPGLGLGHRRRRATSPCGGAGLPRAGQ